MAKIPKGDMREAFSTVTLKDKDGNVIFSKGKHIVPPPQIDDDDGELIGIATGEDYDPDWRLDGWEPVENYSPDQARASDGKWSAVEGGGADDAKARMEKAKSYNIGDRLTGISRGVAKAFKRINKKYPPLPPAKQAAGHDTLAKYMDKAGNITPERKALHDEIVSKALEGKPAKMRPEFMILGGGMAAGKSTILNSGVVKTPDDHVLVDGDGIKAEIPEYAAMLEHKDGRAASYAHEESSILAKRVMAGAFAGRQNVVMDGTGNASLDGLRKKCDAARAAGHIVRGEYVTVPTQLAVERNIARGAKTGRLIAEEALRDTHAAVSRILPEAVKAGVFDTVRLWDSSVGGTPRLVMSAVGKDMTIHDGGLWNNFLAKGKER